MEKICRVCRDATANLVDIFTTQHQQNGCPSLAEMISECTSCEVNRNDPLPQQMCSACVGDVENCFRFKQKCEQSHLYFWQQLCAKEMLETADWQLAALAKNVTKEEEEERPQEEDFQAKLETQSNTSQSSWNHHDSLPAFQQLVKYNSFIECDVQFETNSELERNSNSKPHFCSICGKEFISLKKLGIHERFHARKREHKCPQCSKAFLNPGNLADHLRAHTGERPYKCPHCVKAFTQRGRLNEHIRTHTGERPFKCHECPRSFASAGNLTVHKRIHTGERPHKCNLCHAAYAQPGALQRHIRSHDGDRPFKCVICGMSFSRSSYLKRHMHSHTADAAAGGRETI
ncbi:zinc finger protein 22 [Drosophila grimshawi]|uniref:GH13049 n=1 Tax=Drosophila grimshawi TaxID=7222 RepID=B4JZX7_DROGR|nr:zinc finger protein 22 [Drosophila grimshawi]EDV94267.1 GH13049 [Drosophila grimshawi]